MTPSTFTSDRALPSFRQRTWFFVRVLALQLFRGAFQKRPKAKQIRDAFQLRRHFPFELGTSISKLKSTTDPREQRLVLGKIENLRLACRTIDGAVIEPGELFSFWGQMGPAWRVRGFKTGREVREGCIIPTVGGGLCQISGALHEAARTAGLEIVERHRHTARLDDVPFSPERDATVFWNYVDLRIRAPADSRIAIEARLTPEELIVRIRAERKNVGTRADGAASRDSSLVAPRIVESCDSCGEKSCARHVPGAAGLPAVAARVDGHVKTAAILDNVEPEFESYLSGELIDTYLLPAKGRRYKWYVPSSAELKVAWIQGLWRAMFFRFGARRGRIAAELKLLASERLAEAFARMIPYDVEHLIVTQDFLPFLWRLGALGGRTFDVLLTRPPLAVVHRRLDEAASHLPRLAHLKEFRAPAGVVAAESEAFVYADRVITPHEDDSREFPNLRKLEWQRPVVEPSPGVRNPHFLLFPANLAAREGVHAALGAAEQIGLPLLVAGRDLEGIAAPSDAVRFTTVEEIPWHEVAAVVHPTLFESWPRLHLHALALGIPVIATEACGLEEGDGVTFVPFNDEPTLVRALERVLRGQDVPMPEFVSPIDEMSP